MQELLGIPAGIVPFCIVSIGYPGEEKAAENRYDKTKVHHDKW